MKIVKKYKKYLRFYYEDEYLGGFLLEDSENDEYYLPSHKEIQNYIKTLATNYKIDINDIKIKIITDIREEELCKIEEINKEDI